MVSFFRKIYLLGLFVGVWIKKNFPLKSPVNLLGIIQVTICVYLSKTCEKRDVSSEKILQLNVVL